MPNIWSNYGIIQAQCESDITGLSKIVECNLNRCIPQGHYFIPHCIAHVRVS